MINSGINVSLSLNDRFIMACSIIPGHESREIMSAKVSPEGKPSAPVNLYDDAEDEERVPPVTADANGAAFNTSAAAMRRYIYYTL